MKYTVYVLTFIAYAMNHACRMTYAYNKPNIRDVYGLTPVHLGLIDALIYISYGIGSFFRYHFFGCCQLTKLYLISTICISSFFSCLPIISLFFPEDLIYHTKNDRIIISVDIAIAISMVGYGFSHLAIWQTVLTLMSNQWNSKKQGSSLGLWTSMSCIGNIIGFFSSNFMTQSLNCKWEVTMLLFATLNLAFALLMYFIIEQPNSSEEAIQICNSLVEDHSRPEIIHNYIENDPITTEECVEYIKQKLVTWDFRLYIITASCVKVLNSSFLFWYPTYLFVQDFYTSSGYITMLFQFASIFGSFFIGKMMMYDKITCFSFGNHQSEDNLCSKIMTIVLKLRNVLMILFSVAMSFLFLQNFGSLSANILITILLGCTIGGIFKANGTFNILMLGGHVPRNVDMVSTFSTAFGNCVLGLFQLVIGLMVNTKIPPNTTEKQIKHIKAWSYRNFFKVMIVMMLITATFMLLRSGVLWMLCQNAKKKETETSTKSDQRQYVQIQSHKI